MGPIAGPAKSTHSETRMNTTITSADRAVSRSTVAATLQEYHARIGHRDSAYFTHFTKVNEHDFLAYTLPRKLTDGNMIWPYDRVLEYRMFNTFGGWEREWHTVNTAELDLSKMQSITEADSALTLHRYPSVILFHLLEAVSDRVTQSAIEYYTERLYGASGESIGQAIAEFVQRCQPSEPSEAILENHPGLEVSALLKTIIRNCQHQALGGY